MARAALESARLLTWNSLTGSTSPIDGHASLANITVGNLVSPQIEKPLTDDRINEPVYAYGT